MSNSKSVMKSQRRKKLFAVRQFGGKCQLCGYDKCEGALQFHHVEPSNKKRKPSYVIMKWSWERAYEELKKCILVCANCHAELHYQERELDGRVMKPTIQLNCKRCSKLFETRNPDQQFCGSMCMRYYSRKVERPLKEELISLLEGNTWTALGRKFGVSDNAVRKWAKQYDILPR